MYVSWTVDNLAKVILCIILFCGETNYHFFFVLSKLMSLSLIFQSLHFSFFLDNMLDIWSIKDDVKVFGRSNLVLYFVRAKSW